MVYCLLHGTESVKLIRVLWMYESFPQPRSGHRFHQRKFRMLPMLYPSQIRMEHCTARYDQAFCFLN
jgi:hypothetical protein